MKKLRKNSRQSLILLLLFLGVNFTYSQSDSLIKSEFKKLLIISKLEATIKLEIVDSGITKSYRTENERKIVFSKTQFGILSQSEDKKYDIHILRFISPLPKS